ncbi:MAG: metal ABC transporter permease [Clostridiales bacterium]|nr:metal ABC transporter permease [Clostridiales bacterium]
MIGFILHVFSYAFARRALIVGVSVALCASLLGVSLVLKRYSMIGDGLSHVGFGAMCVAMAMNLAPLSVSIPVVIVAAFLLLRISESSAVKGDSAIALISGTSIAVGLIAASLADGLNNDVSGYMFGSILSMKKSDVPVSVCLSAVVLFLYILFYNKIFAVTFDESFSKATGTRTKLYNTVISLLTAVTIVVGMKIMGTILISSLIIFPSLSAMRVCKSFRSVVILSAVISVICFFWGIVGSFAFETPAGATVVAADAVVFTAMCLAGFIMRRVKKKDVR